MKILTVIYHENENHYNMALRSWGSMPKECEIVAVVNRKIDKEYPKHVTYIENDENCLSKAWNIGLREIFKTEDIAFVSGLDSECPDLEELQIMVDRLKSNPKMGLISATHIGIGSKPIISPVDVPVRHGDGSFSFFAITKECFERVGNFDERFKPAYFEDNDYLERLWTKGYKPLRLESVQYFHLVQGTLKYGKESQENYPKYMQKNLELFKSIHGKIPDHLPEDIKFI